MSRNEVDRRADTGALRAMTQARVSLGRFGSGVPTRAAQSFLLDHAKAREAVWTTADMTKLSGRLSALSLPVVEVESLAADRSIYIRRPDLGRQASKASLERLAPYHGAGQVAIVIGDGLSSSAVELNAVPVVTHLTGLLRSAGFALGPLVLASQARVALADPVGQALNAEYSVMLIGERPGLSAADSLGAYITYQPRSGTPDSRRNCISNIRDGGLSARAAAEAIVALLVDMRRARLSGVALKGAIEALESEPLHPALT